MIFENGSHNVQLQLQEEDNKCTKSHASALKMFECTKCVRAEKYAKLQTTILTLRTGQSVEQRTLNTLDNTIFDDIAEMAK